LPSSHCGHPKRQNGMSHTDTTGEHREASQIGGAGAWCWWSYRQQQHQSMLKWTVVAAHSAASGAWIPMARGHEAGLMVHGTVKRGEVTGDAGTRWRSLNQKYIGHCANAHNSILCLCIHHECRDGQSTLYAHHAACVFYGRHSHVAVTKGFERHPHA
jgi:hypothetical protein